MYKKRYKIEQTKRRPIDNTSTGHYLEQLISNQSIHPVVVVDKDNNKVTIPSMNFVGSEGYILITKRQTSNPRYIEKTNLDRPISSLEIIIKPDEIQDGPLYVTECDVVLCLPKHINIAQHPRFAASYEDAVNKVYQEIKDDIRLPTLRVLANDPEGKIKKLYLSIEGVIKEIMVADYTAEDGYCILLYPKTEYTESKKIVLPLNAIKNGNGVLSHNNHIYYIGLSRADVSKQQHNVKEERLNLYTKDELNIKLQELELKLQKDIEDLRNKEKYWKDKYDNSNKQYEVYKEDAELKIKNITAQKQEIENILTSREAFDKMRTAELSKEKVEISNKVEEYKLYGTIAKIGLPILLSVTTYLLYKKKG